MTTPRPLAKSLAAAAAAAAVLAGLAGAPSAARPSSPRTPAPCHPMLAHLILQGVLGRRGLCVAAGRCGGRSGAGHCAALQRRRGSGGAVDRLRGWVG